MFISFAGNSHDWLRFKKDFKGMLCGIVKVVNLSITLTCE
jgi:hypothetical protein